MNTTMQIGSRHTLVLALISGVSSVKNEAFSARRHLLGFGLKVAGVGSMNPLVSRALTEAMPMPALSSAQSEAYGKARISYPDFLLSKTGLQYKDARTGSGEPAQKGDRVVLSWEGYTIGYYGRPFEKRSSIKGGAFEDTPEYFRFVIGKGNAIAALEEGLLGMRVGGIRQLVVPPELGYPLGSDQQHDLVGPKPSTFSGQRALDFVLGNKGMIDKTLLINVELKRVDRPGERGFKG